MFETNKILNKLNKLIENGINITRRSQEGDAVYSSDPNLLDNVHRNYMVWKEDIKDLLNQEKKIYKKMDIGIFYQGDSVSSLKGGIEYGNINSQKSQMLLKNIRVETTKKLKWLRGIKQKLEKDRNKIWRWIKSVVKFTLDKLPFLFFIFIF